MYFQIIALCTLGVVLFGTSVCIQKQTSCNIISYMALLGMAMYINVMAINVYYSIQNYNVYLKNTKEFLMVLSGVAFVDVLFFLTLVKSLKIKFNKVKNYTPLGGLLLFVTLNVFNGYYLFKSLLQA
jgi:hypothetical protein